MELFRAYDMRGVYPKDINSDVARRLAHALVTFSSCKRVVIGHDSRLSGPELENALTEGFVHCGVDIDLLGVVTTDVLYYMAGKHQYDLGIMITASHTPGNLNGFKFLKNGSEPICKGQGMEELKKIFNQDPNCSSTQKGVVTHKDPWDEFIESSYTFDALDISKIKPFKVVIDAGNGVGGLLIEKGFKNIPCTVIPMFFEPDGNFPNHKPDPTLVEARSLIEQRIKEENADLGVMFDGDADRIVLLDEQGKRINGEFIVGLLAKLMLSYRQGGTVLHDIRAYRYVVDVVKEAGGTPKVELVGHAYIKASMMKANAVFAGEGSGHTYYHFGTFATENSLIALLQFLQIISEDGRKVSEIFNELQEQYPTSGEINFSVENQQEAICAVREKFRTGGEVSDFDTLTVTFPTWHFNLRPSENDPVIRLTLEADTWKLLEEKKQEMVSYIQQFGEH